VKIGGSKAAPIDSGAATLATAKAVTDCRGVTPITAQQQGGHHVHQWNGELWPTRTPATFVHEHVEHVS
jgi:hypothetical protein